MSKRVIRAAFESRLKAWADAQLPPIKVAWENAPFTPPTDAVYLRVYILPAATVSGDLKGDHRSYRGIFHINMVAPAGNGAGQAEAITQALADLFPVNLRMERSGIACMVYTPMSEGQSNTDNPDYTIPVSCQYRADTI